jgi:arabinogalactan oligomer/maltooligosaccharide transport system permease protein
LEPATLKGFGGYLMKVATSKKSKTLSHLYIWILILFTVFPIYVVIESSFNPTGSLASSSFWPSSFSWKNYKELFTDPAVPYTTWLLNSAILATANALLSVFIGATSAFAFSRLRFKGRKLGLQSLLLVQVFPSFLALAAIYVMMEKVYTVFPAIGLGSIGGLLLIYLGGAMGVNIWLLRGYIDTIPLELDEAARIDGASTFQVYWLIFFPLATPVLAVTALLSFIGTFNEFVLASLFLTDVHHRTVAVGLQSFVGAQFGQNWGPFAAGSLIAAIPLVAVFLGLQRFIIGGLTQGATKG